LELVVRFADFLLRLRKPKTVPVPTHSVRRSRHAMPHLYAELGQEMRALRTTEASTIAAFYAVTGLIFAGGATVLSSDSFQFPVKAAAIIGSVVFLLAFWLMVHSRIAHDNASYAHLMSRRRWIEQRWFWPGMPGRPPNIGHGPSGPGYRKTQALVALSALAVSTVLLTLLALMPRTTQPHPQDQRCAALPSYSAASAASPRALCSSANSSKT
jgi:hypothetical protein